jgi:hypothetical protein
MMAGKLDDTCKVSEDVKPKSDVAKSVNAAENKGKNNE